MNKPELRVLQVFSVLGVGGAETWLMSLLKYFKENADDLPYRVKFDICLTGGEKAFFDEQAISLGANLHYIKYSRKTLPSFIIKFRKLLSKGRYHAIHDHQDYTAGWHFLFGLGLLPSVRITHVHNPLIHIENYSVSFSRNVTIEAGKYLLRHLATHISGTSRQIVTKYGFDDSSFNKVKLGAVHCGFDVDGFKGDYGSSHDAICNEFGWESNVKIILFVGRLDSITNGGVNQKNPEFALDVMKECVLREPSICCLMVGGGDSIKDELDNKIKSWALKNKIRLTGMRTDIPGLMAGSELLLFPSLAEGLGMVAVEAQAAGLRVLASDTTPRECSVIPGMVTFNSIDAEPEDWIDKILQLISLPRPDQAECIQAVRNSPFSIENSAERLMKMYSSGIEVSLKNELDL